MIWLVFDSALAMLLSRYSKNWKIYKICDIFRQKVANSCLLMLHNLCHELWHVFHAGKNWVSVFSVQQKIQDSMTSVIWGLKRRSSLFCVSVVYKIAQFCISYNSIAGFCENPLYQFMPRKNCQIHEPVCVICNEEFSRPVRNVGSIIAVSVFEGALL